MIQLIVNGIITGLLYAIIGTGYSVVYYTTRIFHLAFSSLIIFCPYLTINLFLVFKFPFYFSFIISIITTIILSVLIDILVYQPLIKKRCSNNISFLSSLGSMIIITNILNLIFGNETQILNRDINPAIVSNYLNISESQIYIAIVCILVLAIFFIFLKFTKIGIILRAYRDNEQLLQFKGYNISKIRIYIFIISPIFASIAGILYANDFGVDSMTGINLLVNSIVALIIGGIGNYSSGVIGGLILGIAQSVLILLIPNIYIDSLTFIIFILLLILKPEGITGNKIRIA